MSLLLILNSLLINKFSILDEVKQVNEEKEDEHRQVTACNLFHKTQMHFMLQLMNLQSRFHYGVGNEK